MAEKNGGWAFPTKERKSAAGFGYDHHYHGMTLRDYFAAKALTYCLECQLDATESALMAYRVADAMLKAREVGK